MVMLRRPHEVHDKPHPYFVDGVLMAVDRDHIISKGRDIQGEAYEINSNLPGYRGF